MSVVFGYNGKPIRINKEDYYIEIHYNHCDQIVSKYWKRYDGTMIEAQYREYHYNGELYRAYDTEGNMLEFDSRGLPVK